MKRRPSSSDLNQLLEESMNAYEYEYDGSLVEQVPANGGGGGGVDNICYRFRLATDAAGLEVADSNRYDSYCRDKQQGAASAVAVVNVDSENYMLRGIATDSPRSRSYSFNNSGGQQQQHIVFKEKQPVDLDMFYVRDASSSLAGSEAAAVAASLGSVAVTHMPDNSLVLGNCVSIPAGVTTSCARTLSFHALFCSCRMTCCCMCGSLCSSDCHACFHSLCVRFATNYVCQRNNYVQLPATLNNDKVRNHLLLFCICIHRVLSYDIYLDNSVTYARRYLILFTRKISAFSLYLPGSSNHV